MNLKKICMGTMVIIVDSFVFERRSFKSYEGTDTKFSWPNPEDSYNGILLLTVEILNDLGAAVAGGAAAKAALILGRGRLQLEAVLPRGGGQGVEVRHVHVHRLRDHCKQVQSHV